MGRFRDLWASGKFVTKRREEEASPQSQQSAEAMKMMRELDPDFAIPESSREILAALSSRRGQETGRWLKSLVPGQEASASRAQAAVATEASGASVFDDLVAVMDQLFKEFSELTYEFNKSAVGSDLLISYEKPQLFEKKSDEIWYRPVSKTYQGRLTTRQWALVVKGADKKVSIFLIPAAVLLAFSSGQMTQDEMPPFMEIAHNGDGTWKVGGEIAPTSALPPLAKELLGDLIRVSSGVMNDNELFSAQSEKPALGQNLAVGYKPQAQAAPAQAPPMQKESGEAMNMHDACDIVDYIVEQELKRLYEMAKTALPGTANAELARKQISAVESFRIKMVDAFEEYTHTLHTLEEPATAAAAKS